MRTIWKYPIPVDDPTYGGPDPFTLKLPGDDPVVINFDVQNGVTCMWAVVDPDGPEKEYKFLLRGTGHSIPDSVDIEAGASCIDGPFVWHLLFLGEA